MADLGCLAPLLVMYFLGFICGIAFCRRKRDD